MAKKTIEITCYKRINTNRKFVKRKLSQKIKNYDIKNNCAIRKKKKF